MSKGNIKQLWSTLRTSTRGHRTFRRWDCRLRWRDLGGKLSPHGVSCTSSWWSVYIEVHGILGSIKWNGSVSSAGLCSPITPLQWAHGGYVSQSQSPKWKRADTQPRSNWPETFVISIDYHFERFSVLTWRSTDTTMADFDVLSSFPGGELIGWGLIRKLIGRLVMRVQPRYYHSSSLSVVCSWAR